MEIDMRDVRNKYNSHKQNARKRGVEFKLTFDEWWAIWKPHWNNRGSRTGQFVMCRTMDKGAYEVGNVRIDTVKGNAHTRALTAYDKRMKDLQESYRDNSSDFVEDDDDGWLPRELKNPYRTVSFYR